MASMFQDDGARRFDTISLDQKIPLPSRGLDTLGSTSYAEPRSLERHGAEEHCAADDHRKERHAHGHVLWRKERRVPDVGGIGWRTKAGHLLKNQAYYPQLSKVNKWDLPTHAGVNTWQEWHGPKMRTDGEMMERLDEFEQMKEQEEARKLFVNTTRVETLDRFYNKKLNRSQLESSGNWAPHNRARREVHSSHETFSGDLDAKPEGELKKIFTDMVMKRDRDGIRQIADRIQNEETWKAVWKQMEQERRADILADLQSRQAHTDLLMKMSGQPVREERSRSLPNNCSERTHRLAQPRDVHKLKDVTRLTDFRGMIHSDYEHAVEAMLPGFGHELCLKFRENATTSTQPGFPKPARAETPTQSRRQARLAMTKAEDVEQYAIPASQARIEKAATRRNDPALHDYSKAQYLPTKAPPPPDQIDTLLQEDFSPSTSLRDPNRVTTGNFMRTAHYKTPTKPSKHTTPNAQAIGHAPPARRQYVYPVVVHASPTAKPQVRSCDVSAVTSAEGSPQAGMKRTKSEGFVSPVSTVHSSHMSSRGLTVKNSVTASQFRQATKATREVCDELDQFEDQFEGVPRVSNFFGTPRKSSSTTLLPRAA